MNVKSKLPFNFYLKFCVIVSILTLLAYLLKFVPTNNFWTSRPEDWGQFGDFIGGFLGTVIGLINLVVLVYLTKYVADEDNRKALNQFRFDAYQEIKKELESFNPKQRFLKKEHNQLLITIKGLEDFAFLFNDNKSEYLSKCQALFESTEFLPSWINNTHGDSGDKLYHGNPDALPKFEGAKKDLLASIQKAIVGVY